MRDMAITPAGESFSELEEEFFRAGEAIESAPAVERFDDLDAGHVPAPGLMARIFGKRSVRAATEPPPPAPVRRRAPTRPPSDDGGDEWEWQIAIARARHASEGAI